MEYSKLDKSNKINNFNITFVDNDSYSSDDELYDSYN